MSPNEIFKTAVKKIVNLILFNQNCLISMEFNESFEHFQWHYKIGGDKFCGANY